MIKYLIKNPVKWSELELYKFIQTFNLSFDTEIFNYLNAPSNEIAFIRTLKPVERDIYERLSLANYNDDNELLEAVYLFAEEVMRDKTKNLLSESLKEINQVDIFETLEKVLDGTKKVLDSTKIEEKNYYKEFLENLYRKMINDEELIVSNILTDFFTFIETELTIIGARPSIGKTALGLCIMLELCPNISIDFISGEMPISSILSRMAAYELNIPVSRIKTGRLSEHEYDLIADKIKEFEENENLNLYEAFDLRKIKRIISNSDSKMFIIDYAQLIKTGNKERRLEVAEVGRELKLICNSKRKIGILLSQIKRDASNRRPILSDLKESGDLEQDANNVIFIHRATEAMTDEEKNDLGDDELETTELIFAKYRDNERGKIVNCRFRKGKFYPYEMTYSGTPTIDNRVDDDVPF